MSEKLLVRFGFRARTFVYLFLHRGEWKTVDEIAESTGLSITSVISACKFLAKSFPNLVEERNGKFRFKKFIKRRGVYG